LSHNTNTSKTISADTGLFSTPLCSILPCTMRITLSLIPYLLPLLTAAEEWTLLDLSRKCDTAATVCAWTFTIDNSGGTQTSAPQLTPCSLIVTATGSTRADEAFGGPTDCSAYNVTSGWSEQFGQEAGFSTVSVFVPSLDKIGWFSYTDVELKDSKVSWRREIQRSTTQ
jgi:hypothetical protein